MCAPLPAFIMLLVMTAVLCGPHWLEISGDCTHVELLISHSHEDRQDLKQQHTSLPPSVRVSVGIAKGLECWGIPHVCIKSSSAVCPAVGIAVIAPLLAQLEEVRCWFQ